MASGGIKRRRGGSVARKPTADQIRDVVLCLKEGNCHDVAAGVIGVHESAFSRWFVKGARRPKGHPWRDFHDAVRAADSEWERNKVKLINDAAEDDLRYAQWMLSRKVPHRWARRDNVQVAGAIMSDVDFAGARAKLVELLEKQAADLKIQIPPADAPPPPVAATEGGPNGGASSPAQPV